MRCAVAAPFTVKCVHLSSAHPPFDTRIFWKECVTLTQAGHDVSLIVPHLRDEVVEDVRILAVPTPGSRRERVSKTVGQVYARARLERADIYHFHDPELIPVGLALKASGARVIYDAHENTSKQIRSKQWINPLIRGALSTTVGVGEVGAAQVFDRVVAATPGIARHFPLGSAVEVQNFPFAGELWTPDPVPHAARPLQMAYVGVITPIRGTQGMIDAAAILGDTTLALGGRFAPVEHYEHMKARPGWAHVRELGVLKRPQVRDLLAQSRVGMVVLSPEPNYIDSQPTKMFEYMSAGLPVVASNFPLWRSIVEGAGCGISVDPGDPQAIAAAVREILDDPQRGEEMGRRGRRAVLERYNWAPEGARLVDLYEELGTRPS